MKKTFFFLSILFVSFSGFQYALADDFSGLKVGSRSDQVKALQEVLKQDTAIYPEGLTTGYFGPITRKAIEKVQARCGVLETGVVDENTVRCIFPQDYQVRVSSPNGGEKWSRDQIQTIKWEVIKPGQEILKPGEKFRPPIWPKASIDLFRRLSKIDLETCSVSPEGVSTCPVESVFVKHLATVNLLKDSYSWKIDSDIANGSDYVIRITVGEGIVPMYLYEKGEEAVRPDIWPSPNVNWDESDNPFTIEGKVTPPVPELKQVLEILEKIAQDLVKVTQLLKDIISRQ